eukprot:gb/GECH01011365.1/.p1 GENE.gb/GECH01011365.1/~~gb/GECH01011365.1/.p1  ORF type:complete len:533 (+),score=81.98 gb/GECH01011365.1/:1-1599(+)
MDKPFIVTEDRSSNCCGRITCIITFVVLLVAALVGFVNVGLNSAIVAKKIFDDYSNTESITRKFEFAPNNYANSGDLVSWCNGTKLCGGLGFSFNGGVWLHEEIKPSSADTVALNDERVIYVAADNTKENIFAALYKVNGAPSVSISAQVIGKGAVVIGVGSISDSDFVVFSSTPNGIKAQYMSIDITSNQFISQHNLTIVPNFSSSDKKEAYATCINSNYCALLYKKVNDCYQSVIQVDTQKQTMVLLNQEKTGRFTWRGQIKGTNVDENRFAVTSNRYIAMYHIDITGKLKVDTVGIPYTGLNDALVQSITSTFNNIIVVVLADSDGHSRVITSSPDSITPSVAPLFHNNVLKPDTMTTCYMNHSQDAGSNLNATGIFTFFRSNEDNSSYMMRMSAIPHNGKYTTVFSLPVPLSYKVDGEYFLECDMKYNSIFEAYSSPFPGGRAIVSSAGDRIAGVYDGDAGSSKVNVRMRGIVSGYQNLRPGHEYFSNIWGELTINPFEAAFARPIGRAISDTELLLYEDLNDMSKFI